MNKQNALKKEDFSSSLVGRHVKELVSWKKQLALSHFCMYAIKITLCHNKYKVENLRQKIIVF